MKNHLVVILLSLFIMQQGYAQVRFKSSPENSTKDFQYILKNLTIKKEYKISTNVEQFKKIVIGDWYVSDQDHLIRFLENGTYHLVYDYFQEKKKKYFTVKGIWKIEGDTILLMPENKRRPTIKLEVEYYTYLKEHSKGIKKRNRHQFILSIQFTDKTTVKTEFFAMWIHFDYLKKEAKQNK